MTLSRSSLKGFGQSRLNAVLAHGFFVGILGTLLFPAKHGFGKNFDAEPQVIGKIPVKNPAFLSLVPGIKPGTQELIVSSFGVMGGDQIQSFAINPEQLGQLNTLKARQLTSKLPWPNLTYPVPPEVRGPNFVAVGTGFLVPGRTTGGVYLIDQVSGQYESLTKPKQDWFYHKVAWADMNHDGKLDIITARAKKPMFGPSAGELLWLEQPQTISHIQSFAGGQQGQPWKEHLIAQGPDVNFEVLDLNQDGSPEIIASEFFAKKLTIHWQPSEGSEKWQSRTIDNDVGSAFDVLSHDLNGDGKLDLVVTNHEGNQKASVFAFEIPADFENQPWTKHVLLTGILTEVSAINAASPGSPLIWEIPGQKPHILVAGDGSSKVHWLAPQNNFSDSWSYESKVMLDTESTVGTMALGDIDQDGEKELFVPAYDTHHVYVLKLPKLSVEPTPVETPKPVRDHAAP